MWQVFPASAGVILQVDILDGAGDSFPRIRGGDPERFVNHYAKQGFSPHPRG